MSAEISPPRRVAFPALTILLLAGLCAYCNSFTKAFVFDDSRWISDNPRLKEPLVYLREDLGGRTLVALSIVLNYQVGGLHPFGYHLVNVAVHLLAAMTLFAIVRFTLALPRWPARVQDSASGFALAVALLWMLHPLQTQSVTYIIQRCESMMGLFFLLTLYCALRGWNVSGGRSIHAWHGASIVCCLLSSACKEVVAVAFPLVVLYDWIFLAPPGISFLAVLRCRWLLYTGLLLISLSIVGKDLLAPTDAVNAGFSYTGVSSRDYLFTQAGVLLYYLRLAVWPSPLCMDYLDWPKAQAVTDWLPQGLVIVSLLLLTVYGVWRRSWMGFVGAWFFVILAPTSSIVPIADFVFEHRLYLPLASIVVFVVAGVDALINRLVGQEEGRDSLSGAVATGCLLLSSATLGALTVARNEDYRTNEVMYADNVAKRPNCMRPRLNLASSLRSRGEIEQAREQFDIVYQVIPDNPQAQGMRGLLLFDEGKFKEAIVHFQYRLKTEQNNQDAYQTLLAECYVLVGDLPAAESQLRQAIEAFPSSIRHHVCLALVLVDLKKPDEARGEIAKALDMEPDIAEKFRRSAITLALADVKGHPGQTRALQAQAIPEARRACLLSSNDPASLDVLATAYANNGQFAEAVKTGREALARARATRDKLLAEDIARRLALFENKQPYTQQSARSPKGETKRKDER